GEPGGRPVRPGLSLGDIAAGLFAAIGILAAVHERERSGEGQMLDISMLDCQIAILENAYMRYFATGKPPEPIGTRHPSATPFQAFPTADGHLVIALSWGVENQWELLCAELGVPQLMDDERFITSGRRTANHAELEPLLEAAFRARTTAEWLPRLEAIGVPCGPLNTIPQAAEMPQVAAREMLVDVAHPRIGSLRIANSPVRLSRTPGRVHGGPPDMGEHTIEVLRGRLGLTEERIDALKQAGVIATERPPLPDMLRG
ncbi:MAG TPA: CaiB/BaiF CoA-transferase family protein, partial [Dehalococcoidia bacterium]|nr:CaiB/BaiF CoA-transferase family protein [Dehalococcoidia bacterium]